MSEYLLTVIGTVLLSAILTAIIPEGKAASLIKVVTRLACVVAIISPIMEFFQNEKLVGKDENSEVFFEETVIEREETFIQYYSEMRIKETETKLKKELEEKFMAVESVFMDWEIEKESMNPMESGIKIKSVHVRVKDRSNGEAMKKMWEYLTQNYCSEVLIE